MIEQIESKIKLCSLLLTSQLSDSFKKNFLKFNLRKSL